MSICPLRSASGLATLRARLVAEAGGYLRNVTHEPGVACALCGGPVNPGFVECHRCATDRDQFGDQLADLVVPVCYGIKGKQSGYLMWSYKDLNYPVRRNRTLLSMLLLVTLASHEPCLVRAVGREIDAWAIVPSTRGRLGEHPLRQVAGTAGLRQRDEVRLSANEWPEAQERVTAVDRFAVAGLSGGAAEHVLLIDDTWACGAHSQSAALALRRAGARAVSILVLARWLNPGEGQRTATFVRDALAGPFDPSICPVSGLRCGAGG